MSVRRIGPLILSLMLVPAGLCEGVLTVGTPKVEGTNVTVPVILEGQVDNGVAALDFTLHYDPKVLAPGGVRPGDVTVAADKGIQYNMVSPGQYVVMMFGLNQTTVQNGKVADITMRRLDTANGGETNIAIDNTTLASLEGKTIASRGSSTTLNLETKPPDDTNPGDTTPPPDDTTEPPTTEPTSPPNDATPPSPGQEAGVPDSDDQSIPPGGTPTSVPGGRAGASALGGTTVNGLDMSASGKQRLSEQARDVAARLAKLQKAARELERKRAALPGSVGSDGEGIENEKPATAPDASGAPSKDNSQMAALPSPGNVVGQERQDDRDPQASLSPVGSGAVVAPVAAQQPAQPSRAALTQSVKRLLIVAALVVALAAGIVLRRKLVR